MTCRLRPLRRDHLPRAEEIAKNSNAGKVKYIFR